MTTTTNETLDPKIVEKIKKLMALAASGGATEAEASLAAERAGEIMAKYNLTMATLEASGETAEGGKRVAGQSRKRAMYRWQQQLMTEVARTCFCHVDVVMDYHVRRGTGIISDKRSPQGYRLIGREANVVSARELFDYLVESITRILTEVELPGSGEQATSRRASSFKEGCADRLRERLAERHDAALAEQAREVRAERARARHPSAAPTANALVVLTEFASTEEDLNADFRAGNPPGTRARLRAEREARVDAYRAQIEERIVALMQKDPTMSRDVAHRLAAGYSDTRAEAEIALGLREDPNKREETEKQKAAREAKATRDDARYWERIRARDERAAAKKDWGAYHRGQEAGDRIGLDRQIDDEGTPLLGK